MCSPAADRLPTGDIAARDPRAGDPRTPVVLGVFNADPRRAALSFRRPADLDAEVACFGHGDPVTHDAAAISAPRPGGLAS